MRTKLYANILALLALIFISSSGMAQEITGFWAITEVKVGNEIMTPVAKWTKINEDHTFQNGNGWQQNSAGSWTYDKKSGVFLLQPSHGIGVEDEEGAFRVNFHGEKMIWEREEDGLSVVVQLERITQAPMAPADQIIGLWDLSKVTQDGEDTSTAFDPDKRHFLFIRWDNLLVERTAKGERAMRYWFMDAKSPVLTFISFNKDKEHERWQVSFNASELVMQGISDTNKDIVMVYTKMNKFPE